MRNVNIISAAALSTIVRVLCLRLLSRGLAGLLGVFLAGTILLFSGCQQPTSPLLTIHESRNHIRPVWSRDGRTIAFTATINQVEGLYLVDTSGANMRLLHKASALAGYTWSPDSRSIVYSDSGNLYRITVNGDSVTQLTGSSSDIEPGWSYDGTRILFLRNSDASILNLVTDSVSTVVSGVLYPTWHPNGHFVSVQYSYAGGGYYTYWFLDVQPDSSLGNYIWTFTDYGVCGFISLNPTGTTVRQMAFAFLPFGDYAQIWIVDVMSGTYFQLTDDGGDYPCYSPDGTKIVFTRTLNGDGGLWIINTDRTGKHRLTTP
jgi:Tol biopolymer transport system component